METTSRQHCQTIHFLFPSKASGSHFLPSATPRRSASPLPSLTAFLVAAPAYQSLSQQAGASLGTWCRAGEQVSRTALQASEPRSTVHSQNIKQGDVLYDWFSLLELSINLLSLSLKHTQPHTRANWKFKQGPPCCQVTVLSTQPAVCLMLKSDAISVMQHCRQTLARGFV